MPAALYVPLGLLISLLSLHAHPRPFSETALWIGGGLLSWTLIEYLLHRFVFHGTFEREPWRALTSGFHLSHHEAVLTHEPDFVITRPAGSLPFAILFYLAFSLATWSPTAGALWITGVFAGYLAYECAHYAAHHFQPKNRAGRYLRRYHLQHHHRCPDGRFGVTSPFWDLVFHTYKIKPGP